MRRLLADMYASGIRSARFHGRLAGISSRNHIVLTSVESPMGFMDDHLWLKRDAFWRLPPVGSDLEFTAHIRRYVRGSDNSEDFTLDDVHVLEVQL